MSISYSATAEASNISNLLTVICPDGRPIEIRCITNERCFSGVFDNYELAGKRAAELNTSGANCYVGLHSLRSSVPVSNSLRAGAAISSEDIQQIDFVLVDVDPVREPKSAATESERLKARSVLDDLVEFLVRECGWPDPLLTDSGNGFHALFKTQLNTDDSVAIHAFLHALSQRFNTDGAKVDTSVSDPTRVCRLPGTINRKGEPSGERPHRGASIIEHGSCGLLSREMIIEATEFLLRLENRQSPDDAGADAAQIDAARMWLSKLERPMQSSNDKQLCRLACGLLIDFDLSRPQARELLTNELQPEILRGQVTVKTIAKILDWAIKQKKSAGDRVGKLGVQAPMNQSATILPDESNDKKKKSDQALLVELAKARQKLWHTQERETFASIPIENGGHANLKINSIEYRDRLMAMFYQAYDKIPSSYALDSAINTLSGLATVDGECRETFLRVGEHEDNIYVDIGNDTWSCVEITPAGWRIINDPPVMFRRGTGFAELPQPSTAGNVGHLVEFLNVGSIEDFILVLGFLVMSFHPKGEYVILILYGRQGSSKSTCAIVLRQLSDPNDAPLRSSPKSDQDFAVTAYNNRLVVFDNLSYIDGTLSDSLCRMTTGGTFTARKLYSDREESLVSFCNPAILNGVVDLAKRPDLLDRCLIIDLPRIEKRIPKSEFWAGFDEARPLILGGLFDAVSYALANPINEIEKLPRMAEFAKWVTSAEPELIRQMEDYRTQRNITGEKWLPGDFLNAYWQNIEASTTTATDLVPFIPYLEAFVLESGGSIRMPATKLLTELKTRADASGEATHKASGWPQSATAFGASLQRLIPVLNELGYHVERQRDDGGARTRHWYIERIDGGAGGDSLQEPSSLPPTDDKTCEPPVSGVPKVDPVVGEPDYQARQRERFKPRKKSWETESVNPLSETEERELNDLMKLVSEAADLDIDNSPASED